MVGIVYVDMLKAFILSVLKDDDPNDIYFQQVRAPPQGGDGLLESQVSRGEPLTWPPHSPDLIPLTFFFRECIKDAVRAPPFAATLAELAWKVRAAVNLDLVNNACTETGYRYICWANHGSLTERRSQNLGSYNVPKCV